MWGNIMLNVDVLAGTSIATACKEICALSKRTKIPVKMHFNGIPTVAQPDTRPEDLAQAWDKQMASKLPFKYAIVHNT